MTLPLVALTEELLPPIVRTGAEASPGLSPGRIVTSAAQSSPTSHTVLYIEDNLSNLNLVERLLSRQPGIELLAAMRGGIGLEMAAQHQPDLILLDLHLPDISGEEVLRRLQADLATTAIPVVVVSADAIPDQVAALLAAGAHDYMTKPLDLKQFLQMLQKCFHSAKSRVAGKAA